MLPNIKPLTNAQKDFLSKFPNTLYCYIHDFGKDMPVIHSEVLNLDNQAKGYGTYFTVNGFTGGKRTSETLTNVNAFFVDIDFPDKANKTDEKVRQYKNDLLMEMMDAELPIPTYIIETKNGFHVYWMLEKPIFLSELNPAQQENLRAEYYKVEQAIIERFDGDPAAKDVARVLRVPGTMHQKDPQHPFEVKIVHASTGGECLYTFNDIREAFLKKPAAEGWAVAQGENPINEEVKAGIEKEYPKLDRPSYKKLFSKEKGSIPEGLRNKALLVAAYAAKEAGWDINKTYAHFNEFHGLSVREIRKTIRSAYDHSYDFGYNNEIMQAVADQPERNKLSEVTSKVLSGATKEKRATSNNQQKEKYLTYEYVIANRYPYLKYKDRGDFYNYRDGWYQMRQVEDVRSMIFREMFQDGLLNYRKVSAANDKIANFKSLDGRTFRHEDENPDDHILNFKNGLLNLDTFELLPHDPNYLSTYQIPVMFNKDAKAPRWLQFIDEVTMGDPEQQKLLQQIAGYALTNDTRYAKAFILFGSGANGKSLFTRILTKIVGQKNVSTVKLSTITKQFGITGLIGKKINFIDEISGHYFESDAIKGIISGEPMAAEIKYRPEPLEFIPVVKLIFSVNELPKINDTTPGLYRRFIIVPFDRSFQANPDLGLEAKLTEELPGILNWAVEGLKMLRAEGRFNETQRNRDMMTVFKSDNSPVVEFLNTIYEASPEGQEEQFAVPVAELYSQYREYCFSHGYKPKALAGFSRELFNSNIEGFNLKKLQDGEKKAVRVSGIRRSTSLGGERRIYPGDKGYV